ncbi:hypothetical protein A9W97_18695 [Mycobacterium gordonae]|nr:SIR2 family protein [Mycobacterium gordonae]OBJ86041.1 hypothetical protein A9W97_18695 [Mycobacterium gordonae]
MDSARSKTVGHVFVVKADVTTIDCDAWLCPTDPDFHVTAGFASAVGLSQEGCLEEMSWDDAAVPFNPKHTRPLIVLGNVGNYEAKSPHDVEHQVSKLKPVVKAFVRIAIEYCCVPNSELPLRLALPLIGTGQGGLRGAKGDTIKPLLSTLTDLAREHNIDLVLCTREDLAWSAVQAARDQTARDGWELFDVEEQLAQHLAEAARADRLVLFIGAGVSSDAGLPGWQALLDSLRPALPKDQQELLQKVDLRDQAALIQAEIGGRKKFLEKITETLRQHQRIGLTHALLASLGVREAVTTNYDQLYERARDHRAAGIGERPTVLPYGRVAENSPWLLKLHGCISQPDHIVITRSDYLRLARERSALFGIVQALLLTKHSLFVGYSLADDDFHQLVEEIRIMTDLSKPRHPLGTVLAIEDWPLADLWTDVLDVHRVGDGLPAPSSRRLQILLDRVAHLSAPKDLHLLDESFNGLLDAADVDIAASLRELRKKAARVIEQLPDHPTARAVERMLERFTGTEEP